MGLPDFWTLPDCEAPPDLGSGAIRVGGSNPRSGVGRGPDTSTSSICLAVCQRSLTESASAFITSDSARGLTVGASLRRGTNCSGIAMRSVAVGGACPVNR